jgi:hypothetical protein
MYASHCRDLLTSQSEKIDPIADAVVDSSNDLEIDKVDEDKLLRRMDGFIMPILGVSLSPSTPIPVMVD